MADTKKCSACGFVKPISEFYRRGDRDAPRSQCKSCMETKRAAESERHKARAAAWRAADPDRARASVRSSNRKYKEQRSAAKRTKRLNPDFREKDIARSKKWRENNRTRHIENAIRWANNNKAHIVDYLRRYVRDNPDKYRAYHHKRRALKRQNKGSYTDADVRELRRIHGDKCAVCLKPLHGKGHVDHIRALVNGGCNWPRNLQLLCGACNSRKRSKDFTAFLIEIGALGISFEDLFSNVDRHQTFTQRSPAQRAWRAAGPENSASQDREGCAFS